MGVLLDSSFLIDLLRSQEKAHDLLSEIEDSNEVPLLCTPVVYELLAGIRQKGSRAELVKIESFVSDFATIDFDIVAARRGAEIRAETHRTGRPIGMVDVMIAGIALAHSHSIVSRDQALLDISTLFGLRVRSY